MKNGLIVAVALGCLIAPATLFAGGEKKVEKKTHVVVKDGEVIHFDGKAPGFVFRDGFASGGFLGVHLTDMTPELRKHFGASGDAGVLVAKVVDESPAAKAGIRTGDIIVSIDGKKIDSGRAVGDAIRGKKDGEQAKIEVVRSGARQQFFAAIEERKRPETRVFVGDDEFRFSFGDDERSRLSAEQRMELEKRRAEAMKRVHEYFESPEWKARMERVDDCDRMRARLVDLEKKMKALEKKLQEK